MDAVSTATPAPTPARSRRPNRTCAGFTLIELLVVLVIMGLMVGLVSAVIRPDDSGRLRIEAERLAQLLDLAALEGRLTGNAIAWSAEGPGYRFWRRTGDGDWSELRDNDLLRARELPAPMHIVGLQVENVPVRTGMRLQFGPDDPTQAFAIQMELGRARYSVIASPLGELRVQPGEGDPLATVAQR